MFTIDLQLRQQPIPGQVSCGLVNASMRDAQHTCQLPNRHQRPLKEAIQHAFLRAPEKRGQHVNLDFSERLQSPMSHRKRRPLRHPLVGNLSSLRNAGQDVPEVQPVGK